MKTIRSALLILAFFGLLACQPTSKPGGGSARPQPVTPNSPTCFGEKPVFETASKTAALAYKLSKDCKATEAELAQFFGD